METAWSCIENWSLVTDRTWLQLMCPQDCIVLISEYGGTEIVLELTGVNGARRVKIN